MLKRFLIILSLLFTSSLMAMDRVATVTNDDNKKEIYELMIETTENGSLYKLHVLSNLSKPDIYSFDQVSKGIDLVKREKRSIVKLQSIDIDPLAGGVVEVNYLNNGITGKRKSCKIKILSEDGHWVMKTLDNVLIKSLHFTVKKLAFKVIGLDEMLINRK